MQAKLNNLLWEAQMKYNQAGEEIERLLPGGLTSERQYDQAGRPAAHKVSRKGVVQSWKKYTWDMNDRLTNVFDAIAQTNINFRHYTLSNLIFAQYADNGIIHRTTDSTGNIYENTAKTDRKYNSAGALLESDNYIYKYDEEGYLISKTDKGNLKKTKYEWYANGMLKKVIRPDSKEVTFTYDALGRRISKCFGGKITRWVWDNDVPLHEWCYSENEKPRAGVNEWGEITYDKQEPNPANAFTEVNGITWVFEAAKYIPAAKIENNKTYSIICDHLGTPKWMYDAAGKIVWEGVLDIYGRNRTLQGRNSSLPFRYPGQYEDVETGLYYNRFRYYDPEQGNYISQDPIGLAGQNPTLYGYVTDPNFWIDPYGLQCWSTSRKKFWKQEAIDNPHRYSPKNLKRMADGKAPRIRVEVLNLKTRKREIKDVSIELHHTSLPQRGAGQKAHESWNLTRATPWAHEGMDPFRHTGSKLLRIIKGTTTW
jgi:RHS repeat-associated protein